VNGVESIPHCECGEEEEYVDEFVLGPELRKYEKYVKWVAIYEVHQVDEVEDKFRVSNRAE
jgi:hypothetical protein